jgi:hypothetical protein
MVVAYNLLSLGGTIHHPSIKEKLCYLGQLMRRGKHTTSAKYFVAVLLKDCFIRFSCRQDGVIVFVGWSDSTSLINPDVSHSLFWNSSWM